MPRAGGHGRSCPPANPDPVDDREPEAAGGHGMTFGLAIFVKGGLHARHTGELQRVLKGRRQADGGQWRPFGPNSTTL